MNPTILNPNSLASCDSPWWHPNKEYNVSAKPINPIPQVPCLSIGSIESSASKPSEPFISPCPATKGKSLTLKFLRTLYLWSNASFDNINLSSNIWKNLSISLFASIPIRGKLIVIGAIFPLPLHPGSPLIFFIKYVLHPIVAGKYPWS